MAIAAVTIFEEYARRVYGWAYRLLGHHHDALDVVQDVFVSWMRQCAREVPRQPCGWLRTVTMNRAMTLRRGDAARPNRPLTNELPAAALARPFAEADQTVLRGAVNTALDELTEIQRCVLVAKVYDGLTFRKIAEEQELAVSTVKTHYLRAVRALRDRLQPDWLEEA